MGVSTIYRLHTVNTVNKLIMCALISLNRVALRALCNGKLICKFTQSNFRSTRDTDTDTGTDTDDQLLICNYNFCIIIGEQLKLAAQLVDPSKQIFVPI